MRPPTASGTHHKKLVLEFDLQYMSLPKLKAYTRMLHGGSGSWREKQNSLDGPTQNILGLIKCQHPLWGLATTQYNISNFKGKKNIKKPILVDIL